MGKKLSKDFTLFTERKEKGKEREDSPRRQQIFLQREARPALVVSSTSWTPDEDFGILFDAIKLLEAKIEEVENAETTGARPFPHVVFVITGKGPEKEKYEKLIAEQKFRHCHVLTMWLTPENYPKLLGACDLGISLHTSSSGLDLPMKVVDMFGCGLPVCSYKFACINELVKHKRNGLLFEDSAQLARQLYRLLKDFPNKSELQRITKEETERWQDNWLKNAWTRVFQPLLLQRKQ
jgi:beta-1,4-mannosyltransferase